MTRTAIALFLAAAGAAVLAVFPGAAAVEAHATPGGPGMIVVADRDADRVLVFHPNGTFAFSIGTAGAAPLWGPSAVAVGPDGRIYVVDYGGSRVHVLHPNGTFALHAWLAGSVEGDSHDIAVGPNGRVALTGSFAPAHSGTPRDLVRVLHPNGTFAFSIGPGSFIDHPAGVAVGPGGRVYVADPGGNRVLVFHPNGTPAPGISVSDSGLRLSSELAVGPDGRVYASTISLTGGHYISAFHPNGTFAFSTGAGSHRVSGVAVGADGRVVVTDGAHTHDDHVRVLHPNGTLAFTFGPHDRVHDLVPDPAGVAVGPDGRVYVSSFWDESVQAFHPNGTFAFALGPDGPDSGIFESPSAVAVGPDGRVYVAEDLYNYNYSVRVFHPNGTPAPSFARGGVLDYVGGPGGRVAVGPGGRVAVLEETADRPYRDFVRVFHPNGTPAFSIWPGRNHTDVLQDVDIGPGGRVYVVENGGRDENGIVNYSVRVFHPNGTPAFAFPLHTGLISDPPSIAVGPGGRVYEVHPEWPNVWSTGVPGSVQVYHPNGTFELSIGPHGPGDGEFYAPSDVDVGPDGRVYVAEGSSAQGYVLVFDPDGTLALITERGRISPGALEGPSDVAVGPGLPPILERTCTPDTPRSHCSIHYVDPGPPPCPPPAGPPCFMPNLPGNTTAPPPQPPVVVAPPVNATVPPPTPPLPSPVVAVLPNGTVAPAPGATPPPSANVVVPSGSSVPGCEETGECNIPENVTVDIGGEVTWLNNDTAAHTVTSGTPDGGPDGTFDSGLFMPGSTFSFEFEKAGTYPYFCIVHPWRTGTVTASGALPAADAAAAGVVIDVAGLAGPAGPPLDGSESSTVTFPPSETAVVAPFATVTFPPGVAATHVPAGGRLALHVAADVPDDARVQGALAYEGSGRITLQRVVEVGAASGRVEFDMPVRILLEGQAGGRAFYIEGGADGGTITPIDAACAADDTARVHRHLGGAGECQMDSADGGDKIIYTYHLTRFGTAVAERSAPPPAVHTCSVGLGMPDLGMSAGPGGRSEPVRQAVLNTGNLPFVGVGLEATPWLAESGARAAAAPPVPPPPVVGAGSGSAAHVNTGSLVLSLPASATEMSTAGASGPYAVLAGGTAVAAGLGGGQEAPLWFRLNLTPYDDLRAGTTLVQNITYHAECVPS